MTDRRHLARLYGPPVSELQRQRVLRGWTQERVGAEVAALLGRHRPYTGGFVHRVEIGHYAPAPAAFLAALAQLFGVPEAVIRAWLPDSQERAA